MNQMLRTVLVAPGTGTRAKVGSYDLAGKTGTTSDYRDAWFVGYTGGFVTAVWLGRDDNTPMRRVAGGGAPAGIWHDFMAQALPRLKVQPIPGGTADVPPPTAPVADPIGDLINPQGQLAQPPHIQPPPAQRPEDPPY
jgi:penicillin-binding protein 1A